MDEKSIEKQLYLVRGDRILQWIKDDQLNEDTMVDLQRNIVWGFPNTKKRQYATDPVQIVQMKMKPWQKSTKLLIDVLAKGVEGKTYQSQILFQQVKYEKEDTDQNVTFVAVDGESYNIQPIPLTSNHVKVRCQCLDFYYRFAHWNKQHNVLYGRSPPLYRRKTTTRPPVNPGRVPGICKHLIKTVAALQDAGILADE